jgi:phenylalanyl-tRNA synthetase beta chain
MKLPVSLAKQFTEIEYDSQRLQKEISEKICNIEELQDISEEYKDIVIGEIKEKKEHPDADKLAVYKLNIGEKKDIQVVAGDKTLEEGEKVAFFKPGARIPYSKGEEYIIKVVKMRGIESQGMMASEKELNLGPDHTRVMRLDSDAVPGQSFAEYFGLDDTIIDIENKGLTNRGDLFGIIGIARELSAIQGRKFETPEWMNNTSIKEPDKDCLRIDVKNDAESVCPRYTAVAMSNIKIKESPVWIKSALIKYGLRPVNNIVDITNYLMILTGQPLHAFDYDKIIKNDIEEKDEAHIIIRMAKEGEKLHLIKGDLVELHDRNLVIADSSNPIGIAGIMGGIDTEVDSNTERIVIESANFDRFNIRRTSMQLGLNTDASDRFKRSQDPNMCLPVLIKTVEMIQDLAEGEIASSLFDIYPSPVEPKVISFDISRMNNILGIHLEYEDVENILTNLGYLVKRDKKSENYITVTVPTFRRDVSIQEDIFEDIGRIYGYEKITASLPVTEMRATKTPLILETKKKISNILSNSGSNEIITYNFVSSDLLNKASQDANIAYHIKNAISLELEYMRPSLIPSLIDKLQMNLNKGHKEVSLFETNISHQKGVIDEEELPLECWYLSFIYSNKDSNVFNGSSYYMVKRYLEKLLNGLGIHSVKYTLCIDYDLENSSIWLKNISNTFDLNTSAVISTDKGNVLGILGNLANTVKENFTLPAYTCAFEINISELIPLEDEQKYIKEPVYPAISRDICFSVEENIKYSEIKDELMKILNTDELYSQMECLDIYKAEEKDNTRKITFRISIQSYKKTLREKDFSKILEKVQKDIKKKFNVDIVE